MEKDTGRLALISVILGICVVTLLPVHSGLLEHWRTADALPLTPASLWANLGVTTLDLVQNILLFVPLGWIAFGQVRGDFRPRIGIMLAVALGLALSGAVEILQTRISGRFPSRN